MTQAGASTETKITIKHIKNGIQIDWVGTILTATESDGIISCFIPDLNIRFGAKNDAQMQQKAKDMTTIFFEHYLVGSNATGLRGLALALNRKGFKADNMIKFKELLNNKKLDSAFKSIHSAADYPHYERQQVMHDSYTTSLMAS
nr:hypothetical protein [Bacteroidota bacterium]